MRTLASAISDMRSAEPRLFTGVGYIEPTIADGDGMLGPGGEEYYLRVGLSAADLLQEALRVSSTDKAAIGKTLDFACGYGRVARMLKAVFPSAALTVCDLDRKAVAATVSILGCEYAYSEKDLGSFTLPTQYDLIWVGSLFTHIDVEYSEVVLGFLARHLAPGGILVFTTHGELVAKRIFSGERPYSLDPDQIGALRQEYEDSDFAFQPYRGQTDYGISIARPSHISRLIESEGSLNQTLYIERGWVRHQDVYVSVAKAP